MHAYRLRQTRSGSLVGIPFRAPIQEASLRVVVRSRLLLHRGPFTIRHKRADEPVFGGRRGPMDKKRAYGFALQLMTNSRPGAVVEISNEHGWILRAKVVSALSLLSDEAADVLRLARTQLGARYVFADINPFGPEGGYGGSFDCSGLFCWTFQQTGIIFPHSANQIMHDPRTLPFNDRLLLRPGDFIFYWYPNSRGLSPGEASHIGQWTGNGLNIEASYRQGVVLEREVDWNSVIKFAHVRGVTAPDEL